MTCFPFSLTASESCFVCLNIDADAKLSKASSLPVGKCPADPKDAVRDMKLSPDDTLTLVPVRPDNVLRTYAVDQNIGELTPIADVPVENPVFICLAEL